MMSTINIDNHRYHCNNNDVKHEDVRNTYTAEELEVASILLHLPILFPPIINNNNNYYNNSNNFSSPSSSTQIINHGSNCNRNSKFPIWVSKKRRSVLDSPPPPPPCVVKLLPQVTSPSSPLSLSTSQEPPLQHCHKRKHSSRLTSEKLQVILAEAIETKQTLQKEIEGVDNLLKKLKAENYQLKSELEIRRMEGERREIEETQVVEEVEKRVVFLGFNNNNNNNNEVTKRGQETTSTCGDAVNDKVHNPAPSIPPPRGEIQDEQKHKSGRRGLDIDLNIPSMEMEEEEIMDTVRSKSSEEDETMKNNMREDDVEEREKKSEADADDTQKWKINRQERLKKMKMKMKMKSKSIKQRRQHPVAT